MCNVNLNIAHSSFVIQHFKRPGCDLLWVYGFRFSFTPLAGVLFAFPSRYCCTIGSNGVFSLGSWSTRIPAGFPVSRRTQEPPRGVNSVPRTGISPSLSGFPKPFRYAVVFSKLRPFRAGGPTTPGPALKLGRFRLLRFRSPLLSESLLISVPGVLRWFSSPSFASANYVFICGCPTA